MTNKIQTIFFCSSCDAQFPKWSGRCLSCGAWGTLQKQTINQDKYNHSQITEEAPAEIINLNDYKQKNQDRIKTKISEVDRVLGGGIMPGSLILVGGEPGIGKSTILAQITDSINQNNNDAKTIYVSGEESASQVKDRFSRLNCKLDKINFIGDINVEKIISAIKKTSPLLVIIDSIQTVYSREVPSEAGSINQIRACASKFLQVAKENNIAIILVGHITKDGQVAGPKSLEHIVDTVAYLETEAAENYRILRTVKNRFGSINELGIFEMTSAGFKEIQNPSQIFIKKSNEKITGSVISVIMEGTRPFLVEIQALVSKTVFGYPQRKASGYDINRLQVLCSVLTKRTKINLNNQDVILNLVGGIKTNDPALDLAVCLAIVSSLLNQSFDTKTIALGEVGLGGEIRNVSRLKERVIEAERLGFVDAIIPHTKINTKKIKIKNIKKLDQLIDLLS